MEPSKSSAFNIDVQSVANFIRPPCSSFSTAAHDDLEGVIRQSPQQRLRFVQHSLRTLRDQLVANSACEEVADLCRDLLRMGLEREVARVEEMDHRHREYRA